MLHEIFKGMDNGAEMINENFQEGSVVEHNLNETNPENGYYVKFGNGFAVCWRSYTFNRSSSNGASGIAKPIEFSSVIPLFGGTSLDNSHDLSADAADESVLGLRNYYDAWSFGKVGSESFRNGGDLTITLWAAGVVG